MGCPSSSDGSADCRNIRSSSNHRSTNHRCSTSFGNICFAYNWNSGFDRIACSRCWLWVPHHYPLRVSEHEPTGATSLINLGFVILCYLALLSRGGAECLSVRWSQELTGLIATVVGK